MTIPLRSFPQTEQYIVAKRRVAGKTGGLGYLAALDFINRKETVKKEVVVAAPEVVVAVAASV